MSAAKTFDALPCVESDLAELSIELFRVAYLPNAVAPEVIAENHRARTGATRRAHRPWIRRIQDEYAQCSFDFEGHCLATLNHYRSLMPMAMEARKPMFFLKRADGAIGSHVAAVRDCYREFETLANRLLQEVQL